MYGEASPAERDKYLGGRRDQGGDGDRDERAVFRA